MSTPSPASIPARSVKPFLTGRAPAPLPGGRIIREKRKNATGTPAVFVRPQPGWMFPDAVAPESAVRLAVGGAWVALSRAEALRLADALVDTVEELEAHDPTEARP